MSSRSIHRKGGGHQVWVAWSGEAPRRRRRRRRCRRSVATPTVVAAAVGQTEKNRTREVMEGRGRRRRRAPRRRYPDGPIEADRRSWTIPGRIGGVRGAQRGPQCLPMELCRPATNKPNDSTRPARRRRSGTVGLIGPGRSLRLWLGTMPTTFLCANTTHTGSTWGCPRARPVRPTCTRWVHGRCRWRRPRRPWRRHGLRTEVLRHKRLRRKSVGACTLLRGDAVRGPTVGVRQEGQGRWCAWGPCGSLHGPSTSGTEGVGGPARAVFRVRGHGDGRLSGARRRQTPYGYRRPNCTPTPTTGEGCLDRVGQVLRGRTRGRVEEVLGPRCRSNGPGRFVRPTQEDTAR